MNYVITSYDVINGSKFESREKNKPAPSIEYINMLQKRAERLWQYIHKEELSVCINYKCPVDKHIPWMNDDAFYEKCKKRGYKVKKK